MGINALHSYLVHPSKSDAEQPAIGGASLPNSGRLYTMLEDVYNKSDNECNIDISFDHNEDGEQQNDCRDALVDYIDAPSLAKGRTIAKRLQLVTTHRSGLGLLFLIVGRESADHKVLISRFPADSAILAEEDEHSLNVEFLEKVFMKSATAYKAAVYRGPSTKAHFWSGRAVDKQINDNVLTISNYWIKDFLASDFKTTAAAGTRRLAVTLRNAIRQADDLSVKEEIAAAATLAPALQGKSTSIRAVAKKYGLSDQAQKLLRKQLKSDNLFTEQFTFSRQEFGKHIAFQSVELDNGGILTADATQFDKVFEQEELDAKTKQVRFTTQGRVVDRKLKRSRS